jgi:hypothetical protein
MASSPVSSKSSEVIDVFGSLALNFYIHINIYKRYVAAPALTLEGRKVVMTSETGWLPSAGGGAGTPGVAEPVAISLRADNKKTTFACRHPRARVLCRLAERNVCP